MPFYMLRVCIILTPKFFVVAAALIGLTSCESTKDKIVGSWHYTGNRTTSNGGEFTVDLVGNNKADDTYTSTANCSVFFFFLVDGTKYKVMYSIKDSGEWKINNDKEIVWSPSSVDIKVTSVKYFDPSDDSFIGELTGSDLEEFSKVYAKDMQSDFLEASTERTIMLQDNKYVTVSVDDDGEKETTTYNRL